MRPIFKSYNVEAVGGYHPLIFKCALRSEQQRRRCTAVTDSDESQFAGGSKCCSVLSSMFNYMIFSHKVKYFIQNDNNITKKCNRCAKVVNDSDLYLNYKLCFIISSIIHFGTVKK